ncbi:MAG: glycine cleavage system protein GcvH [Acidimicrobiaceae bacterium]|nr:glycine cleavage system protein GcvH [Acidimicrobiaceae bacterium]
MNIPENLRYSKDHEWARAEGDLIEVGITDYAQDALGDVVYVELPEIDSRLQQHEVFGEVESTKSVSELYAPVSGTVSEVNDDLYGAPQRLNEDPYGEGWICKINCENSDELDNLLDANAYRQLISE